MSNADRVIKAADYKSLTFDCYGTLIDWETGILGYLQPLLQSYYANVIDEWVLTYFSELEPAAQAEGGSYAEVLSRVMQSFATRLGFTPTDDVLAGLADSIQYWPAFADSHHALRQLEQHFDLAIVSNVDTDLFAHSQQTLGVAFSHVITAGDVGVYKPDRAIFDAAAAAVEGPILHVAQSRFHDILPATELGWDTVWINRPSRGAARPVEANPTWTFDSLQAFADAIET